MLEDSNLLDHHVSKPKKSAHIDKTPTKVKEQSADCQFADQSDKQVGVDMVMNTSSVHVEFDTTDDELTDVEHQTKEWYKSKHGLKIDK